MQRRKPIERIINPTYFKDPDYLVIAEDVCSATGEMYPVEVGFAYKYKKGGSIRTTYYEDERIKQILYESQTIYHKPFKRIEADANAFRNAPQVQRTPQPTVEMPAARLMRAGR